MYSSGDATLSSLSPPQTVLYYSASQHAMTCVGCSPLLYNYSASVLVASSAVLTDSSSFRIFPAASYTRGVLSAVTVVVNSVSGITFSLPTAAAVGVTFSTSAVAVSGSSAVQISISLSQLQASSHLTYAAAYQAILRALSIQVASLFYPSSVSFNVSDQCGNSASVLVLPMTLNAGTLPAFSYFSLNFSSAPTLLTPSAVITFSPAPATPASTVSTTALDAVLVSSPPSVYWYFPNAASLFVGSFTYTVSVPASTFQTTVSLPLISIQFVYGAPNFTVSSPANASEGSSALTPFTITFSAPVLTSTATSCLLSVADDSDLSASAVSYLPASVFSNAAYTGGSSGSAVFPAVGATVLLANFSASLVAGRRYHFVIPSCAFYDQGNGNFNVTGLSSYYGAWFVFQNAIAPLVTAYVPPFTYTSPSPVSALSLVFAERISLVATSSGSLYIYQVQVMNTTT